jgi:uncharacterized membrane protein YphA (DoxX/SURF4 family)
MTAATMASHLRDLLVAYGPAGTRLCLAAVFLYSGQDKLRHWRESVAEVDELGLPFPAVLAAATIAVQLIGGMSVLLGIGLMAGAALLALFTVFATLIGHRFWLHRGREARRELTTSLEHLAIVGGLLLSGLTSIQPT